MHTSASERNDSCFGSLTCVTRPPRLYATSPLMGSCSSKEWACVQATTSTCKPCYIALLPSRHMMACSMVCPFELAAQHKAARGSPSHF